MQVYQVITFGREEPGLRIEIVWQTPQKPIPLLKEIGVFGPE
jgi:hypothetical protein